jgi:hypothetical protein
MAAGVVADTLEELQPTHGDVPGLAKADPVRAAEFVMSYTDTWLQWG